MSLIETLRTEREELAAKIKTHAELLHQGDETRDFTAEEAEVWDRLNTDYDSAKGRLDVAERLDLVERDRQEPRAVDRLKTGTKTGDPEGKNLDDDDREAEESLVHPYDQATTEQRAYALQGFLIASAGGEVRAVHERAAKVCGVNLRARELAIPLAADYSQVRKECREQSAFTGPLGGYLRPGEFIPRIESALLAFGGLRNVADVFRTTNGNDISMPSNDDTGNLGAWIGENTDVGNDTDLDFQIHTMKAHKAKSGMLKVPYELLEDSPINLVAFIGERLGERLGRRTAEAYVTGDGVNKPLGLLEGTTEGKETASSTAIDEDELIDLVHSVGSAYRNSGPNVGFLMNDLILAAIRKLKNGSGDYLWEPDYRVGAPDRLLGYPVYIDDAMPSALVASAKSVAFGALGKYMIRDVNEIRIKRLVERYAELDQEGFLAFIRTDGFLMDAGQNPVKHLTQKP